MRKSLCIRFIIAEISRISAGWGDTALACVAARQRTASTLPKVRPQSHRDIRASYLGPRQEQCFTFLKAHKLVASARAVAHKDSWVTQTVQPQSRCHVQILNARV